MTPRSTLPVFPNTQHMTMLAAQVDVMARRAAHLPAYLIDGHGMYAWGRDLAEARRHLDALEFLLELRARPEEIESHEPTAGL